MPGWREVDLDSPQDARLQPYRLRWQGGREPEDGLFLCEGDLTVQRLLHSGVEVHSLLVTDKQLPRLPACGEREIPLMRLPQEWLPLLAGRGYKSGLYGLGRRPRIPLLREWYPAATGMTLVCLPKITTPRNVGAILRVAAGFGVTGVILGEACSDPFHRLAVRAAMGAGLNLSLARSANMAEDLAWLAEGEGFRCLAAVVQGTTQSLYEFRRERGDRVALVLGNEYEGVEEGCLRHCAEGVTIPMAEGVDSFNVATAAAILLYELMRPASVDV
ncbi:MAG: RNA methyltransferase [Magnetococcales bacterium]|nr:RNA methyltransferase [Magnetococcales bacterium]